MKAETLTETQASELTLDYLIARSGLIGRQILRFARFVHEVEDDLSGEASDMAESRLRRRRLLNVRANRRFASLARASWNWLLGGETPTATTRRQQTRNWKASEFTLAIAGLVLPLGLHDGRLLLRLRG